jgi:hypothetical protein
VSPTEYVDVVFRDCWGLDRITEEEHAAACARATDWLTEHEGDTLSITMRPGRTGRHSECEGLYRMGRMGDLVTTRYQDDDEIERVRDLVQSAWEHACQTWPNEAEEAS